MPSYKKSDARAWARQHLVGCSAVTIVHGHRVRTLYRGNTLSRHHRPSNTALHARRSPKH